jgi:hypothetical protein
MAKAPSKRRVLNQPESPSVIPLNIDNPEALTPLNFRVPARFHREFKLYAVQHGMSMVDLLQESFRLWKKSQ